MKGAQKDIIREKILVVLVWREESVKREDHFVGGIIF